ncbi:MAG: DNA translocase FtsK [Chloroflexi bacterium]|nr:DNA translocase FtsK [Chloroflexota bacterium]
MGKTKGKRKKRSTPRSRTTKTKKRSTSRSKRTSRVRERLTRTRQPQIGPWLRALWARIPTQRRLDMASVLTLVAVALSALALVMPQAPGLAWWRRGLLTLLGWTGTLVGLTLLAWAGLAWLLRHREVLPLPNAGRGLGAVLLTLTSSSFAAGLAMAWARNPVAAGGVLGRALARLAIRAFGGWAALILASAMLLLSLSLLFDRPVVWFFAWVRRVLDTARAGLRSLRERLTRPRSSTIPAARAAPEVTQRPRVIAQPLPGATTQPGTARPTPPTWRLPDPARILNPPTPTQAEETLDYERARIIEETLAEFGAPVQVVEILRGPTVTLFGVVPDYIETRSGKVTKVRVNKIVSLADDLALALAAKRIRIQAPVPGRGYIGIEVPNESPRLVPLRRVIESPAFRRLNSPLGMALGEDVAGRAVVADLRKMPHLLIAGATGSGKSVALNSILVTFLLFNTPDQLRLVLIDPKRVELTAYQNIPHLLAPVITDPEAATDALKWVLQEMDRRYQRMARMRVRHMEAYNQRVPPQERMPYLVVMIDELADLMMLAPTETERSITRLAQLARATGIHVILATQRPSVDVVTGLIKANFPARIAFAVASSVDSRVILDRPGAERLLGKGDMLFLPPDAAEPIRVQGAYVSDEEIRRVVQHWRSQLGLGPSEPGMPAGVRTSPVPLREPEPQTLKPQEAPDPLWEKAVTLVRQEGRASISLLQRRLRIGYTRAARLIERMEAEGIVGPPQAGTGVRRVQVPPEEGAPETPSEPSPSAPAADPDSPSPRPDSLS